MKNTHWMPTAHKAWGNAEARPYVFYPSEKKTVEAGRGQVLEGVLQI